MSSAQPIESELNGRRETTPAVDAILDEWFVMRVRFDDVTYLHVIGTIVHDRKERFKSGQTIRTSVIHHAIPGLSPGALIVTENSCYQLGAPMPTAPRSIH